MAIEKYNRFYNQPHDHMNLKLINELEDKGFDVWEDASFNWGGYNKKEKQFVLVSYDHITKNFAKPFFFSEDDLTNLKNKFSAK